MKKSGPYTPFLKSALLCLIAIVIGACGKKNVVTPQAEARVDFYNACIVWNGDSRQSIADSSYVDMAAGRSVALMMPNWALTPYDHYQRQIQTQNLKSVKELLNLCPDEKFASEISYGQCSGFLIDKDIMISAGHCFNNAGLDIHESCSRFSWVFDLNEKRQFIEEDNIFKCQEVLIHSVNEQTGEDFTIFKLDRKARARRPLRIDYDYSANEFSDIAIIGHPLGMKKMIAKDKGTIQLDASDKLNFYYLLDTFPSNSGSPIINQNSGKVIGIHVAGDKNFLTKDEEKGCFRYTNCVGNLNSGNCALSRGITLSSIQKYLTQAQSCQ